MPMWDLTDLLQYLRSDMFEPLDKVAWPLLIQKVSVLLLATSRRLKEIANLSRSFTTVNGRVILHWPKEFIAKNESQYFSAFEPSISRLEDGDETVL